MFLWMTSAQAEIPDWMEIGGMYDTEPMFILAKPYVNYAHGIEANVRLGSGLAKTPSEWSETDHWSAYLDIQQFIDTGDLGAAMGVVQAPQEIYNPAGVYLGELSLTREPGDGWLYLHIGSISADLDFVAPDAAALYVHSAFNNQYNISMEQFPISPFNSLGTVVGATVNDELEVKAGLYQLSRIRTDETVRGWKFDLSKDNGLLGFIQINATIGEEPVNNLPQTGWQLGTFLSKDEEAENREPNHGIYGNYTFQTTGHSVGWFSINQGLHPSVNPVPLWVAGGWISEAHWFERPQDLIVTGLSWSQYSFADPSNQEVMVEAEYHYMVNDWLTLLPNVQYFIDTPEKIVRTPITAGVGIIAER